MDIFWIVLSTVTLLVLLWLFSLRGKRKTNDFYGLKAWHYAHRGLHNAEKNIPENSLSAFRVAVEQGYGAELDVHLTKDGRLVVMHDESLKRTAGVEKNICDCTWEELKLLRLEGTEEPIPLFEEVLALFEGRAPLVVDIITYAGNHNI